MGHFAASDLGLHCFANIYGTFIFRGIPMLEIYCLAGSNYLLPGIKSSSKTNIPSN